MARARRSTAFGFFETVMVDSDHDIDPGCYSKKNHGKSELLAYVAIGEVLKSRPYYPLMPPEMVRGENTVWSSLVIDQTHPKWPEFLLIKLLRLNGPRAIGAFFWTRWIRTN